VYAIICFVHTKLSKITNASSTVGYFESDGYYAKNDPEHKEASQWFGRAAKEIGLTGHVDPKDFAAVLDGNIPSHDILLGRKINNERSHRPGDDLTISCVKSVSIEALVFDKMDVMEVYKNSIENTLEFVEANFIQTRKYDPDTKKTHRVATGNGVIAAFPHEISRNLDPQLHTHCVIANMTKNEEGQWRHLERTGLKRHDRLIAAYFGNEMAKGLLELGYELEPRMIGQFPAFEIKGYDRETIDHFSTRREEMLDYLRERGLPLNPTTTQIAAFATRDKKVEVSRDEIRQQWKDQAQELGLEAPAPRFEKDNIPGDGLTIKGAIRNALEDIEKRESVFGGSKLQTHVLGQLAGRTTLDEINAEIDRMEKEGHLIRAWRKGHDESFVTQKTYKTEVDVINHVLDAKGTAEPLNNDFDTGALNPEFTKGQKQAIEMVMTSTDKVVGVQGGAGTGKTAMLEGLSGQVKASGHELIGLAPTSTATRLLRQDAGIPARTFQHFLTKFSDIDNMDEKTLAGHRQDFENKVLVVDEASMISTRQMDRLFHIQSKLDIPKLILQGDTRQIRAIEAGQPFRVLQDYGMTHTVMNENVRQRGFDKLKVAMEELHHGSPKCAIEHLGGDVIESEKAGRDAAQLWLSFDKEERSEVLLIAQTHAMRADITHPIRDQLKIENELTGKEFDPERLVNRHMLPSQKENHHFYNQGDVLVFHKDVKGRFKAGDHCRVTDIDYEKGELTLEGREKTFKPSDPARNACEVYESRNIRLQNGEMIRFTRGDKNHGIENGDRMTLEKITSRKVTLKDENGDTQVLDRADNAFKHIDYGYSLTVHAAQGITADHVIGVFESDMGGMTDQQSFGVVATRARKSVAIFTNDIEQLSETLELSTGDRMMAIEAVGGLDTLQQAGKEEIGKEGPVNTISLLDLHSVHASALEAKKLEAVNLENMMGEKGDATDITRDEQIQQSAEDPTVSVDETNTPTPPVDKVAPPTSEEPVENNQSQPQQVSETPDVVEHTPSPEPEDTPPPPETENDNNDKDKQKNLDDDFGPSF
jgi:conjugative relaxase-like TrwC/TraI family protein